MINETIPNKVNICSIMYRVIEHEKVIIFTELYGMEFGGSRVAFTHPNCGLWQVELKPQYGNEFPVCHIQKMFELVKEWRGDDFGRPYKK